MQVDRRKIIPVTMKVAKAVLADVWVRFSLIQCLINFYNDFSSHTAFGLPKPQFEKHCHIPIVQEAGWASEPVWMQWLEQKSFASTGDQTPVIQSVIQY
jgi:hypothetical protein